MSSLSQFRHVLVIEDQKSKRIIPLKESNYSIGRDPQSGIPLYDRQVSRHHATILRINDYQNSQYSYRIIDGNLQGKRSTNGIVVNSKYCLSHELKHGDLIRFGGKSKASYHILTSDSDLELLKINDQIENIEFEEIVPQKLPEIIEFEEIVKGKVTDETQYAPNILITSERQIYELEKQKNHQNGNTNTIVLNQNFNESAIAEPVEPVEPIEPIEPVEPVVKLSSLAEYSPNPIIELNFEGQITSLNPAASIKFPELNQSPLKHPLLDGLITESQNKDGTSFVREIETNRGFFGQHIHYLPEQKLIRCYLIDITKYKKSEAKLKVIQGQYQLLINETVEGILLIDVQSKQIIEANRSYCHLLGYNSAELVNLTLYQIIALEREKLDQELQQVTSDRPYLMETSIYRSQDGSLINLETQIRRTFTGEREIFYWSVRDLSKQKHSEAEFNYQTLHDFLTNLPNQALFNQQLSLALTHAQKHEHLMAVLFLNLDSFKKINHTLGHKIGNQILKLFSDRLNSCIRGGDILARWGNDEFCILLPHIKNTEDTVKLAQGIFESLKQPFEINNQQLQLKSSIGIAIYPEDGEDEETLLKNADTALYRSQEQGRNQYQFYNPKMTEEATLLLRMETLLHQALEKRQFSLNYQPQIQVSTGKITGMEALLRWQHPELGLIPPQKFIPLAEKTDLILHLSKWILKTACEQNLAWQKDGLPPFPIAVNLSCREFQQPNLPAIVAKILDETGLDPQWLELEITEMTLRQNLALAQKSLKDLQQLGVHIAMDDFGTGYSALGYMKQFPFHTLKLDQTFIRDLRGTSEEIAMISAIVSLGKGFNLRVVAEGVETQTQLDILTKLNCEEIQGYWFSRPLNSKDATQFLGNK